VKELIELLDGVPLVFFSDLWVNFCASDTRRSLRISVGLTTAKGTLAMATTTANWYSIKRSTDCTARFTTASTRAVGLAVIRNSSFFVAEASFGLDFGIESTESFFGQSIVFEEASDFIVNEFAKLCLFSILELEFVAEHFLELFALLKIHESILALFTKMRAACRTGWSTCHSYFVINWFILTAFTFKLLSNL